MTTEIPREVINQEGTALSKPLVPRNLLDQIRPEWQAKKLIQRVSKLMEVDPSSAVQRLFNAAIHDLRGKIVLAGIDIAKEAAISSRLPTISGPEDVLENYSTERVITLAYKMGLLTRAEWRRISRCYEIRRDLEHEDDQYEAEIEDVIYVFKSCIEVILSKDPVELMRVSDITELVNEPQKAIPSEDFVHDFEIAPYIRQHDIIAHLVKTALDSDEADIIRQNSVELLKRFSPLTRPDVKVEIAKELQSKIGKKDLQLIYAKVAYAAGVLPYLKQRQVRGTFSWLLSNFEQASPHWKSFPRHGEIFENFEDLGGFETCPEELLPPFVEWMTLCYLGEPGGYGDMGRHRPVFYSNVAAPRIASLFELSRLRIEPVFDKVAKGHKVKNALVDKHISRRLENLVDIVTGSAQTSP